MDNWESKMERLLARLDEDRTLTKADYRGILEEFKLMCQERIDASLEL